MSYPQVCPQFVDKYAEKLAVGAEKLAVNDKRA